MGFDLVKTTPLMEYLDMLYTRLAIEMAKHPEVTRWWVELCPPNMLDNQYLNENDRGVVGYINLKSFALASSKVVTYRADFMAAQRGARAGADVLEQVVEHHITQFMNSVMA